MAQETAIAIHLPFLKQKSGDNIHKSVARSGDLFEKVNIMFLFGRKEYGYLWHFENAWAWTAS